jgi:transcriptional regulator with XRE-family HTH domain
MSTTKRKNKLIRELKDKEYRDAFVSEHINTGIPFQIRTLREQRGWTQEDLAIHTGMKQEAISSRIENPNYGKLSLSTLKKIASAFDIGLVVRFVPFGDLVDWDIHLSSKSLRVPSFKDDSYFQQKDEEPHSEILKEMGPRSLLRERQLFDLAIIREAKAASAIDELRTGQHKEQSETPVLGEQFDIYKNYKDKVG